MNNRAFTLIELLVVIAIIGILSGIVIVSLNSAREKGKIASIKSTLKNLQTQAQLYHLENGTFAGMCTYNTTGVTAHASIQSFINSLVSIAGIENIRCIVRTSDVPDTNSGTNFILEDSLETKNFGIAIYYNGIHYGLDSTEMIVLDENDITSPSLTQTWTVATNTCAALGKRLPSVEILKAINDYGAQGGNLGFVPGRYWSSTPSSTSNSHAYANLFNYGSIYRNTSGSVGYVRCGA